MNTNFDDNMAKSSMYHNLANGFQAGSIGWIVNQEKSVKHAKLAHNISEVIVEEN